MISTAGGNAACSRVAAVWLAVFVALAWWCTGAAAADGPWPYPELKHRRHYVVEPRKGAEHQTAAVSFSTGNAMHPLGRDIRVVAGGKEISARLLHIGLGSTCRPAFEVRPGVRDYYVFYGNAESGGNIPSWKPKAGLILETLHFNGGSIDSAFHVQRAIREGGPSYGTDVVPNVFHGYNPFGPSDYYVSHYEGTLWIEREGSYLFATTSDDASVMRVDGRIVAEKYGYAGATRDARHAGKPVNLSAGPHLFEYFHVEGAEYQAAVAAWQPPGGKMHVIPEKAFGVVHRPELADFSIRGQEMAPDIQAVNAGEVIFRDEVMTRFSFRNGATHPDALQFKPHWDFGDGTTSETVSPEHVYFDSGKYDVTLTLSRGGKSWKTTHTIIVDEGWERQTVETADDLPQYYRIVSDYNFQDMAIEHVDRAVDIFEQMKAHAEILRAGGVILARRDEEAVTEEIYLRHALLHAEHLCREMERRSKLPEKDYDDGTVDAWAGVDFLERALAIAAEAEQRLPGRKLKAKAALKHADILFYYAGRHEDARADYRRLLEEYEDLEIPELRVAQIRIGDYHRRKGQTAQARQAYEAATKMLATARIYAQDTARLGAMCGSAENYLRRGELDAAREQLDMWEWEYPAEKLAGRSGMLRAELAEKEHNLPEAIAQLQDVAVGNPDSPHAPEALLRIAKLQTQQENTAEALAACERLRSTYPDSPLKEDADFLSGELMIREKGPQAAIERLQEAAGTYIDSPHLPRAMLTIGTCLQKLGNREEARRVWENLIKEFPESDESKQAEKLLRQQ